MGYINQPCELSIRCQNTTHIHTSESEKFTASGYFTLIFQQYSHQSNHHITTEVWCPISEDISTVLGHLVAVLRSPRRQEFFSCCGVDAQKILDLMQNLLDCGCDSETRPLLFNALVELSGASGLHPTCYMSSGLEAGQPIVAGGSFADIYRGRLQSEDQSVSVKIMRAVQQSDIRDTLKVFKREALILRQLSHPNILPFLGLYYLENRLCLISPWMENGNLAEFLKTIPTDIVRTSLILDIASGVEYLHNQHVLHGDLKAANILVTHSHRACIAVSGLSSIALVMEMSSSELNECSRGGTLRYQAPELIRGQRDHFGSDIYAFACVCYEVCCLTYQRSALTYYFNRHSAIGVVQGLRPARPIVLRQDREVFDHIWELLQECWAQEQDGRPRPGRQSSASSILPLEHNPHQSV
ncbi:kinase-like domain-containing protein [Mycena leptocephala]|nr:kinase-like domain-containing protein [Mycena leptocephala]